MAFLIVNTVYIPVMGDGVTSTFTVPPTLWIQPNITAPLQSPVGALLYPTSVSGPGNASIDGNGNLVLAFNSPWPNGVVDRVQVDLYYNAQSSLTISATPTLPVRANALAPTLTEGSSVPMSADLHGNLRTKLSDGAGNPIGSTSAGSPPVSALDVYIAGGTSLSVGGTVLIGDGINSPASVRAKGLQGSLALTVQNYKDSGRIYIVFTVDAIALVSTEALATMSINKAGMASSSTSYTVTAGKTLRLQSFSIAIITTGGLSNVRGRVRGVPSGSVTVSSPLLCALACSNPTTAGSASAGNDRENFPDGLELPGGTQIGISQIAAGSLTGTFTATLVGYEY